MVQKMDTSPWRKLSIAMYGPPRDGKVLGSYEIDATALLDFIKKKKEEGIRITVTNVVTSAMARAMAFDVPEMNCLVRRGKLIKRENVDVFIAVALGKKGNTGIVLRDADKKTVTELALYQQERLSSVKSGGQSKMDISQTVSKIPWPLRGWIVRFFKWWTMDNGFRFPFMKMDEATLGSFTVTNIGTFGLDVSYTALFPIANYPMVVSIGMIKEKAVVIDGNVEVRPMLPVSGTFDHRILDGSAIGRFTEGAEKRLLNPWVLDENESCDDSA